MKLSEAFAEKLGQLLELFAEETGMEVSHIDFISHPKHRMTAIDVPDMVSKGFVYKQKNGSHWVTLEDRINGISFDATAFLEKGIDIGHICEGEDCHESVDHDGAMCTDCEQKAFQAQAELEAEYRASAL